MEMQVLSELGRWLLEESEWKTAWGRALWSEAFDACGSPTDWESFQKARGDDPRLSSLWKKHHELVVAQSRQARSTRPTVVLPEF